MSLENLIFVIVLATQWLISVFNPIIHNKAYQHLNNVGREGSRTYFAEYGRGSVMRLILLYFLRFPANIALLFLRPDGVSLLGVIVVLILNLAVSTTTQVLAAPVYNRIRQGDSVDSAEMSRLTNINLLRLALSALASLVVLGLLVDLLGN